MTASGVYVQGEAMPDWEAGSTAVGAGFAVLPQEARAYPPTMTDVGRR